MIRLVVFGPLLILSCAWILDPGSYVTAIARWFYRTQGSVLWPIGGEQSYVVMTRFVPSIGCALISIVGIASAFFH